MARKKQPTRRPRGSGGIRFHKSRGGKAYEAVPSLEVNGQRLPSQYFATAAEAEAWLSKLQAAAELKQLSVRKPLPIGTFIAEAYWPAVERANYKPNTVDAYRLLIDAYLLPNIDPRIDLKAFTPDHARALEATLAKTYSRATVTAVLTRLGHILQYAVGRRLIPDNPVRLMRSSRLDRAALTPTVPKSVKWTRAHAMRFLDAIHGTSYEALWLLYMLRDLRLSEGRALLWRNWHADVQPPTIHIEASLYYLRKDAWQRTTPKTPRSVRHVSLHPRISAALERRRSETPWCLPEDFIFSDPAGKPLVQHTIRRWLRTLCQTAAVPVLSPHDFRHFGSSLLDELGVAENVRSVALGHSDEVNRQYTHVADERTVAAFAVVDAALQVG